VHPHHPPASTLALALIIVTFCYVVACACWPFAACRKCHGAGKTRSPSGRAWRYCRRCKGTGARLRLGRRIWNFIRNLHKEGHR
jgi:hypothetical protein